jgi:DNA-directed RNA polymerase specialized sigma subunit
MTNHYVDNAKFLELLKEYIKDRNKRKEEGLPPPEIPNEIGKIFIQIATKLSQRYNFNGYTFKDEMIGDGILNAVEAINGFDPEKGSKPFAYFTQVIFWAFVRRIESEKKEHASRIKMMFDGDVSTFDVRDGDTYSINRDDIFLWYNQR